jgi:hypothetical protein
MQKFIENLSNTIENIGFTKRYTTKLITKLSIIEINEYSADYNGYRDEEVVKSIFASYDFNTLDDILKFMKKSYRIKYKEIFKDLEDNCYSTTHLLDMIIEYGLGQYKPISPDQFLYMPDKNSNIIEENNYIKDDKQFYNIHYDDLLQLPTLIKTLEKPEYTLFYHTTNWKSLESILKHGPISSTGRRCLDFGILSSFYITPDLKTAIEWGKYKGKIWSSETSIIVFQIPTKKLRNYKEFKFPNDEWRKLTKSSRLCYDTKNELDDYGFVYGPMVANIHEIKQNIDPKTHKNIKWQMASKNNNSDKFLNKCLEYVIIIGK